MRLVIDTNIWVYALSNIPEWRYDCESFLFSFMDSGHCLAVDYNRKILKEYDDNLRQNEKYRVFYSMLEKRGRIEFVDSSIPGKHLRKLDELNFHEPEDRVFTGVAYNADKCIVTEESDYGKGPTKEAKSQEKQAVLHYMENDMGIHIYDSVEAKQAIRG